MAYHHEQESPLLFFSSKCTQLSQDCSFHMFFLQRTLYTHAFLARNSRMSGTEIVSQWIQSGIRYLHALNSLALAIVLLELHSRCTQYPSGSVYCRVKQMGVDKMSFRELSDITHSLNTIWIFWVYVLLACKQSLHIYLEISSTEWDMSKQAYVYIEQFLLFWDGLKASF